MYAVIFTAKIGGLDDGYSRLAARMRQLALEEYGCTQFTSCSEGDQEIAISYWPSLEQIQAWKQNSKHLAAQALGRNKWYKSYKVEVVEILREYDSNSR